MKLGGLMDSDGSNDVDFCECNALRRAAEEPNCPIEFDARLNEFHLVYGPEPARHEMMLWFCPFCGGRAPQSLRDTLFAHVTDAEETRLRRLAADVETIEDAIRTSGPPDSDMKDGLVVKKPGDGQSPEESESYRVIHYSALSDTADVRFIDYPQRRVGIQIIGKYIGKDR